MPSDVGPRISLKASFIGWSAAEISFRTFRIPLNRCSRPEVWVILSAKSEIEMVPSSTFSKNFVNLFEIFSTSFLVYPSFFSSASLRSSIFEKPFPAPRNAFSRVSVLSFPFFSASPTAAPNDPAFSTSSSVMTPTLLSP